MKRVFIILFTLLFFAAAITTLIFFGGETREYKFENLFDLDNNLEEPAIGGFIRMDNLSRYRIVYGSGLSEEELSLLCEIRDMVAEKTGVFLEIFDTNTGKSENTYTVAKHEILIGTPYREESYSLLKQTWNGGAYCAMIGKKLVLAYGSQADGLQALTRLMEVLTENCTNGNEYFFAENDGFYDIGHAPVRSLILNGLPITDYTIVNLCDKENSHYEVSAALAEGLRQQLGDICGYLLPVVDVENITSPNPAVLYIGVQPTIDSLLNDWFEPAAETAQWNLYANSSAVYITGTSSYCTARALKELLTKLTPDAPTASLEVLIDKADPVSLPTDFSLLRLDMKMQDLYLTALETILYRDYPDIFALERSGSMSSNLKYYFTGYYDSTPIGSSSILYFCSERFRMVETDEIRLPEKNAGWDETLHGQYVVLEDLMTGKEMVIVTSDVSENTLDELERTLQYLTYPDREILYLGDNLPEQVFTYFPDSEHKAESQTIHTLISDGLRAVHFENCTEAVQRTQDAYYTYTPLRFEAHMIRMQYYVD